MRRLLLLGLIVAGLLAMMAGTRWLTLSPEVRTANAAGQFDAVRAKTRLARIIGDSPAHPADSASSDGVRSRLVAELRAAGLDPQVDDRFACNNLHKQSGATCARVRNVTVTVGTPSTAPFVLVNTHYDSVPVGPGASDAGLGVAAMIEAAALLKDRALPRQMIFLFNEGEELGLVGARAFLNGDPRSRRIDSLVNLEARGTTGPVNMFETSTPNAAAVRLFERAVGRPIANSLAVSAYRLIPNYTDVNTFVDERDWLFLNFAPIGNETRYHSPGDDLAAMDLATLQHMGDQLLEVGGALAATSPASQTPALGERLFMNLGTRWLFVTPMLVAGLALGGLGLAWLVWRRRQLSREPLRPVLTALPVLLLALVTPVALAWAGLSVVGVLREGQFWRAYPKATELAIYAGVIAMALTILTAVARQWTIGQLRRSWWLLFVLLGMAFALAAPGALVYFLLPPFIFAIGAALGGRWRHSETVGAIAAALVLFLTLGAMLGLLQELLNGGPLWAFALFGGVILMPWLIEMRPLVDGPSWRRMAPAAAAFATIAWLPAALVPVYSADRQQQWTLQQVHGVAPTPLWSVVNDRKPLPADFARLGDFRLQVIDALGSRKRWVAPVAKADGRGPILPAPIPGLTPAGSTTSGQTREIRFRLASAGFDSITVQFPAKATVLAMGAPGQMRSMEGAKGPYRLSCTGRSCDGRELAVRLGPEPVLADVIGTRWTLPAEAVPFKAAQPKNARAQYLPDATLVVGKARF